MKIMKSGLVALTICFGLLVGCATKEGPRGPEVVEPPVSENQTKFVLLDKEMEKTISCSGLQERRTTEGYLEVVAHVRNRISKPVRVEVNCEFKDAQGFSTGQVIPWKVISLSENEQRDVRYTSTSTQACTYTIRVRRER